MREKNVNRLQSVNVGAGMVLTATYTGGNTIRVDLSDVARRLEAFAPLESRREFRRAAVVDFGWGVEDIDCQDAIPKPSRRTLSRNLSRWPVRTTSVFCPARRHSASVSL